MLESHYKSYIKKRIAFFSYVNRFLKKSNGIVYTNEEEYKNSKKYQNIPHYIDMNGVELADKLPIRTLSENDPLEMFFLSRFDMNHKGIDILIEAIKGIGDFLFENNIRFSFYGSGSPKQQVKFLERFSNIKNSMVSVKGKIFGEEKRAMFANSHILVLTSRYEGFPTVIIDALSAGIPCVVTAGTNAAFLEEKGLGWCSSCDAQDIAEAIKRAAIEYKSNPEAFQRASREYAERAFDIKNTIENTITVYKRALQE